MTQGACEAEIANAVTRFDREQQGHGPKNVRAFVLGEMVLVRSSGIFTVTETKLSSSDDGRKLILSARRELHSINHEEIEGIIGKICGCAVVRSYYDVNVEAAEQVAVFILDRDLQKSFAFKR
jgi:uncharacterized protein YbcI